MAPHWLSPAFATSLNLLGLILRHSMTSSSWQARISNNHYGRARQGRRRLELLKDPPQGRRWGRSSPVNRIRESLPNLESEELEVDDSIRYMQG
jgi:hypothetical protein